MRAKSDIIKNNIKNKASEHSLTEPTKAKPIENKKNYNFSDNTLPVSSHIEYDDKNNQESSALETPALNLALLKNVLTSLLKILSEENEAMNNNCSMDNVIESHNDKNDFNQYLEWQKPLIDNYLVKMQELTANNNDKFLANHTDYDFDTFKEIADLIQNAKNAAKENVLLLERRKFFNEQFINFLANEIASYGEKANYKYSRSALESRSSVYQNRRSVIVNQKT